MGGRGQAYAMHAEAGKPYDIEIRFQYFSGDAQLNFDLGFKEEVNIKNTVAKVKDADIVIFAGGISPSLRRGDGWCQFTGIPQRRPY